MYAGAALWVGTTRSGAEDREDDALVGIRPALRLGGKTGGVARSMQEVALGFRFGSTADWIALPAPLPQHISRGRSRRWTRRTWPTRSTASAPTAGPERWCRRVLGKRLMCNLYRMTKTTDEVAKWFDAVNARRQPC